MEEKSTASFELLRGSQRGKGLEELLMEIGRGAQSGCYKERRERTFQRSHSESELPIPGSIQAGQVQVLTSKKTCDSPAYF